MNNEILNKLQRFFIIDMKIKKEMLDMCPPNDNEYIDEDTIIKYNDNAYQSLIFIFNELKQITKDIFGQESHFMKKLKAQEKLVIDEFIKCKNNTSKLRKFYTLFISDMDINFIELVKQECVGYTGRYPMKSIENASTVNEILHLIHSYILNNDDIMRIIPIIKEKKNNYNYPISLRGKTNPLFEKLFLEYPNELDCGLTEIVGINDHKLLMMIRDRGHALTIEITLSGNIARLDYFIPKLCNVSMINKLPGINKVNNNGATGVIEVEIEKLGSALYDFISKVPTDNDMDFDINLKITKKG